MEKLQPKPQIMIKLQYTLNFPSATCNLHLFGLEVML